MKSELKLPEKARLKLSALRIAADEAMTLSLVATRRLKDLNDALLITSDPAKFAAIEEQIAQQRGVQSDHKQRHRESAEVVTEVTNWLDAQGPHIAFAPVKAPDVGDLTTDRGAIARISKTRAAIERCKADIRETRNAPAPRADLFDEVDEIVANLAKSGTPRIKVAGGKLEIEWGDATGHGMSSRRIAAIAASIDPDAMTAKLRQTIDALPGTGSALSAEERPIRLDELTSELDDLERREEALIEAAFAKGQSVTRRVKAAPTAVLGIRLSSDRVRTAA